MALRHLTEDEKEELKEQFSTIDKVMIASELGLNRATPPAKTTRLTPHARC